MIHILSDDLINKIAAGEVVERPASVVKELLENAIDARASRIVIEVREAGKKLIRVADNGKGMTPDEIALSLQRHSTSKISSLNDLFNINTLGFRGEALPSIASVSRLRIEPNPSGEGLTVEVKDLFYNTPARKKFLKANATEIGHIGEIVAKYAIAYPGIAIKLNSDEKPLIASPGTGVLKDAVLAIWGAELTRELTEIGNNFPGGRIYGLVSRPTVSRLDKNYQNFYVNGRYVKNFLLNRALEDAYRTLIPNNRYPVGVVFIEIDPKLVDVNVHPTKREVKFARTQEVMEAIKEAVGKALGKGMGEGEEAGIEVRSGGFGSDQLPMTNFNTGVLTFTPVSDLGNYEMQITAVQPLIPLYQFKQTYIVATDGDDLILIDQHAAHERILYDRLSQEGQAIGQQTLLIPETMEMKMAETIILKDNLDELNRLGFEIEEFGANSFIVRSVPAISSKVAPRQLLTDILSDLLEEGKTIQMEIKRENLRKLVACHSAIKAGDKLDPEEMKQLIRDLYATQNPLTCPHGRPTMVRIIEEELKKRFGR